MSFHKQSLRRYLPAPLVVFLIFFALGIWKVFPSLAQPDSMLAPGGDGHSLLGEIYDFSTRVREKGLIELFGDLSVSDRWGDPQLYGDYPVINFLWRVIFVVFAAILSVQDVYDSIAVLGYALSGLCGYLLARKFELGFFSSILFPLFLLLMPNTELRLGGHLLLAFLHLPMLFLAWAVEAGRNPSQRNLYFVVIGLWLTFLVNEYFGYFGAWIGFAMLLAERRRSLQQKLADEVANLFRVSWKPGLLFLLLMSLSYPTVLWGGLLRKIGLLQGYPFPRRFVGMSEFEHYGLKNPLRLFEPSFDFLPSSFLSYFRTSDSPEFTFRIGLIIPLFIVLSCLWLSFKASLESKVKNQLVVLVCGAIVALMLGLHPRWYSLVWATKVLAPMFRVGARAFFYFDALVLMMFFVLMRALWFELVGKASVWYKTSFASVCLLAVGWSGFRDLTTEWFTLFRQHPTYALPESISVARKMRELKDGLVLELPLKSKAGGNVFEDLYPAKLHTIFHEKKCINFMWANRFQSNADEFARDVNSPRDESIKAMRRLGIRYLVVWNHPEIESKLEKLSGISRIVSHGGNSVFEVNYISHDWALDEFLSYTNRLIFRSLNQPRE